MVIFCMDEFGPLGLTGSGSHDIVLSEAIVPTDMTFDIRTGPRAGAAQYAFRSPSGSAEKAPVATGIARGALSLFATLAAQKAPTGSGVALRELPQAQLAFPKRKHACGPAERSCSTPSKRSGRQFSVDGRSRSLNRLSFAWAVRRAVATRS
jgi:hypothetical protein